MNSTRETRSVAGKGRGHGKAKGKGKGKALQRSGQGEKEKQEEKPATELPQQGGTTKEQAELKRRDQWGLATHEGDNESKKEEEEEDPMEETMAFVKTVRDRFTTQHHYVAIAANMDDTETGVRDAQGPMMDNN